MFQFDHVHIVCDDVALVGDFLHDILGADALRKTQTRTLTNWEYCLDGIPIFVRQRRADESLASAAIRRAGVDHLGLRVPDLTAALQRLTAAGCVLVEGPTWVRDTLSTAFVVGPGGLLLELLERRASASA